MESLKDTCFRHSCDLWVVPMQYLRGVGKGKKNGTIKGEPLKATCFRDARDMWVVPKQLLTSVAGSIFGLLSQTHFSESDFKNEISCTALLDIQMILLCVCGVDSFIPGLEHWIEKCSSFHGVFSKKKPFKSDSWIQIHEMKLRSSSSAEKNFPDEITWIHWKRKRESWRYGHSWIHF